MRLVPTALVSSLLLACAPDVSVQTGPPTDGQGDAPDAEAPPAGEASWPSSERFAETAAALPRPWTLAFATRDGEQVLTVARRDGDSWQLAGVFDEREPPCESMPCAWPAALSPVRPLEEPPPLPEELRDTVAYARTLLEFEGPLSVEQGDAVDQYGYDVPGLPETAWAIESPRRAPNLAPFLEQLRRFHPVGRCSMDTAPQHVALMRATAAAQARRTGWAVQGWVDAVAYFSSSRMVWSSYGQSHPERHLELLEMVGVDPARLMLGLLIQLPDQPRVLGLADARRIAPDLGATFTADLRALAADPGLDPYDRALLFAVIADLPFESDPLYASLPEESRALLAFWSR